MTVESTSGPFPTTLGFEFSGRAGGTWVEASVTGRPTGLLRVLEPLVARTTQKNLDQGYACRTQEAGREDGKRPRRFQLAAQPWTQTALAVSELPLLPLDQDRKERDTPGDQGESDSR
jgi:hypothetical protein